MPSGVEAVWQQKGIMVLRGTEELVLDATYSTNGARMDLFAVLTEVDRFGIPLCYMFMNKNRPYKQQ